MAIPSESQINSTHLGLQKQAVDYGEKIVAEKSSVQSKLDAAYSAAGDKVAAARSAYFDAQSNPNTSPTKLQELKANFSNAKDERATIGEQAESNQIALDKAQSGVDSNKVKLADAQNSATTAGTSVTSSEPVFNDASATKADNVGSNNTIPVGEKVTGSDPTDTSVVVGGPIAASAGTVEQKPLDSGEDPYVSNGQSTIPSAAEAQKPLDSGEDPYVSNGQSTVPPVAESQKEIPPEEDPFEKARQDAIANEDASPTEQQVLEASQDAKLSQEEQGQLREFQESQRAVLKAEEAKAGNPEGNWTAGSVDKTRTQQTVFVARNSIQKDDWRIRLSLAPSAKYLYKTAKSGDVLYPLAATDGIVFPYTPVIQTAYRANYEQMDLTHSNYKLHFYKNSNVDDIQVTADFTAQDTTEANYLLAVIHFFRSVTKMFYGQDGNSGPKAGTPPPLCYLNGYGQYQFNEHPVLITSFSYILPNDVDYIRAGSPTVQPGTNTNSFESKKSFSFSDLFSLSKLRAQGSRLKTNSMSAEPKWTNYSNENATYVPTKMQIQLSLVPVVTRNDISKNFSLEKYATGELLKGRTRSGGGMW